MKTSPSVNTHLNKINKKIVVPRHRRDRNGSARQMGMKAEQAFWCCCQKQGYKWENASKAQNCTEHIDCFITKDGKTLSAWISEKGLDGSPIASALKERM